MGFIRKKDETYKLRVPETLYISCLNLIVIYCKISYCQRWLSSRIFVLHVNMIYQRCIQNLPQVFQENIVYFVFLRRVRQSFSTIFLTYLMTFFREIRRALFSCNIRFEIRPFALLQTNLVIGFLISFTSPFPLVLG